MIGLLLVLGCPGPERPDTALVDSGEPMETADTSDSGEPAPQPQWGCAGLDPHDAAPLGRKVALTFDDGPDPVDTPRILDTLRLYQVPATFFVLGDLAGDAEGSLLIEEMRDDPLFDVANHSWDHPDLAAMGEPSVRRQIDDTNDVLAALGVTPTYFRFPYGSSDCDRVALVRELGMISTGWHIDTADWCYATGTVGRCTASDYSRLPDEYADDMLGFTMAQLEAYDGGVVLMHDIHGYTADSLPDLLDRVLASGFEIVPLSDAEAFPGLNSDTPAALPRTGEPCSVREDPCWQLEWNSWCEPTGAGDAGVCVLDCWDGCVQRDGSSALFCAEVSRGEGDCLAVAAPINEQCSLIPGTVNTELGFHGVGVVNEDVCLPEPWR
ncbi:MAG: polysaccharide deacetylase family protein [Alphaproteobacteria bacterium]|nr:polysaccharide deacetylase family protein [Alphaproteobacteria bacterium]